MNIGETIKSIRKRKGLSQKKLAELSGISQTYLSQIEKFGVRNPSLEILTKISLALELPYPVFAFLSLDYSDIAKNKLAAYKKIEPAVDALIKEFFLSEDKNRKKKN
ncbi:MAG: helix-turn-helix transcriptional regulator [Mariniphaga sp.]